MQPLSAFYSDTYVLPLPAGHRFPMEKYRLLREGLASDEFLGRIELHEAPRASDAELLTVHTADYLGRLVRGELTSVEQRRIGFPWSEKMVERSRRSTGGTLAAAKQALDQGAAIHLAGGTHHAYPDHGQGFCVFNDVAVAASVLLQGGLIERAVVIDLDVHQGNGTAAIFAENRSVYTFSMHGDQNYPFRKQEGDLDLAMPSGTGDDAYLAALDDALRTSLPLPSADLVFYLAGADPYEEDRLGRLSLTRAGLAERDRRVYAACQTADAPVVTLMAGGYCEPPSQVAELHLQTVRTLLQSVATPTP